MAELKKAQSVGETPTKSYPFNAQTNKAPFFGGESVGANPSPVAPNPFIDPTPPTQNPVKVQPNKKSVEF